MTSHRKPRKQTGKSGLVGPLVSAVNAALRRAQPVAKLSVRAPEPNPKRGRAVPARSTQATERVLLEALEPRILLSADINPAALTLAGELTKPGEQKVYEFNVDQQTTVILDSLTNNDRLSWSLSGPTGSVASNDFASTGAQQPLQLMAGKYRLTIDGSGDAIGQYGLRVIDAGAAVDLVPGQDTMGELSRGNDSAVYRFNAAAGDKFFFSTLGAAQNTGSVTWRLIDPFGRTEGSSSNTNASSGPVTTKSTGRYLLVVEAANSGSSSQKFGFNLTPVQDEVHALTLNQTSQVQIQPGQTQKLVFDLLQPTSVVLDVTQAGSASNWTTFWSLKGSEGFQRTDVDVYDTHAQRLELAAGHYELSLYKNGYDGEWSGQVRVALHTVEALTDAVLATPTTGTMADPRASASFALDLTAGQRFNLTGSTTNGNVGWSLYDRYGQKVMGGDYLNSTVTPVTISRSDRYTLVLDAFSSNAANAQVGYQFTARQFVDGAEALPADGVVLGQIAVPGQVQSYTFEVQTPDVWAFDSWTNRGDMYWSLLRDGVAIVNNVALSGSDASQRLSALRLEAAHYELRVWAGSNATGEFQFQMLQGAQAVALA